MTHWKHYENISVFALSRCDYWALGAIIFQMVSGLPPFRAINDYHTFQKIQKLDYSFPDGFPDLSKDLVRKFLVRFNSYIHLS